MESTAKRKKIIKGHIANGVVIHDPATTYVDSSVEIEAGAVLYPGAIIEGKSKIESGASVGPNSRIVDSIIKNGASVQYSVVSDSAIGVGCEVGPFAYVRGGAVINEKCRIGFAVEVKNSSVGEKTKASHLAYIGDADVGSGVNFSCGAITVNYDGKAKHRTKINDGAFVGCNSNLIAPVAVGERAFVAAGSTVTVDVPPEALAIARQRQDNKEGWRVKRDEPQREESNGDA